MDDFELWRIEMASKEANLYLKDQEEDLNKYKASATTLFQWNVTLGTALAGVLITKNMLVTGFLMSICIITTSVFCALVNKTTWKWCASTTRAEQILKSKATTKKQLLKSLALGCDLAIANNLQILKIKSMYLEIARISFLITPIVMIISTFLETRITH
ncbi:MAG: hypothetical protein ACRCVY_07770 [Commensalibacter sp.]